VQPSRHNSQATSVRAARAVAALVLVLALLSGIAPSGSFASVSASGCSMSCCIGLPAHAAGECAAVSCHVKLPGQNAAPQDTQGQAHDAHGESHDDDRRNAATPHEVEIAASVHQHEPQPQTATAAHKDGHAAHAGETHGAETLQASESSATANAEHASSKSKRKEHRPSVAPASLARPCPSDCGMAAGNAGNNVRPRDAATLTAAERPRPPTPLAVSNHSSGLPLDSAGKHRLAPPRAPPLYAL